MLIRELSEVSREVGEINYDAVVIHYGEVTLKRSKRGLFERILAENLKRFTGAKVKRLQGRFVIELTSEISLEDLLNKIGRVFGVVWYAPAIKSSSLEELEARILEILRSMNLRKIKIDTRRSDKSFPMTSLDVSRKLGAEIRSKLGLKIDLKNPDKTIFIEITEDGIYASFEKLRGPGGLPIGSSGRILGLFSGANSALACWYMMKRGCHVDLLHVCESSLEEFFKSDLKTLIDKLLEYSLTLKLYLVPFDIFKDFSRNVPEGIREILFTLFLLRIGEAVAEKVGYLGLVTGFSAFSESDFNRLCTLLRFRRLPIYTPLLALEEQEIKDRMRELGFPLGGEFSERFSREVEGDVVEEYWMRCGMDEAVKQALDELRIFRLRLGEEPVEMRRQRVGL